MKTVKQNLDQYAEGLISEGELLLCVGAFVAPYLDRSEVEPLRLAIQAIIDRETVTAEKRMARIEHPAGAFNVAPFVPE